MEAKPTDTQLQTLLSDISDMYISADLRKKSEQIKHEHVQLADGRRFKVGYWFQDNALMIRIVDKTEHEEA